MAEINETHVRQKSESGAVAREQDLNPLLPDGKRKRILTGDRTTGKLHLGHYIGSLKNRVRLQSQYDTFILLADVQALTTHYDRPEVLKQSVIDVALDYLAVGLDPAKATFVIQSMVPAIAELTVYYGLLVPVRTLIDNPTTKAEAEQLGFELTPITESTMIESDLAPEVAALKSGLEAEFTELGSVALASLFDAIELTRHSTDVSVQHELKLHHSEASLIKAFVESTPLRRELRELLIRAKRQRGFSAMTYGFLGYPVSQAADITFVGAHLVPVGEDQVPHIELTREIVRRFNNQYGETLILPQALIGGGGIVKGLDGSAKMSKSLDNAVYLSDDSADIWRKVSRAVTDPQRVRRNDPGRPEVCNIFSYHELFNAETEPTIAAANLDVPSVEKTAELCRSAGIGCVDCKKNLAAKLDALLSPMRERRAQWEATPDKLRTLLQAGTKRAAEEGEKTLAKVKQAMHVDYFSS